MVSRPLALAASFASFASFAYAALPPVEALLSATVIPAIQTVTGVTDAPTSTADAPTPMITQFTPEEFSNWAANASLARRTGTLPIEKRVLTDDRIAVTTSDDTQYPWDAVGRMLSYIGDNTYVVCTGTLVGPRLMASARHCIDSAAQWFLFSPGYDGGDVFETSYVSAIVYLAADTSAGNCDLMNDWALYVLDEPLGSDRGYFQTGDYVADESVVENQAVLFSAGYPGNLNGGNSLYFTDDDTTSLELASSCSNGGPIIGDCYVSSGMSGGPLWLKDGDDRSSYGTLYGGFYDTDGNLLSSIHAHGDSYVDAVSQLNAEYPA
ncbi:trypsin-like cysteine/serine peptidase domain-containing protein [Xylariales sp. PMI_506]|nr:trypsin-like cysteine/serine peptidase domain-containing protein [Xylariales sp. PMI_506]